MISLSAAPPRAILRRVTDVAATPAAPAAHKRTSGAALLVAAGILLSRIAGLIRQRVLGHYLGTSPSADAYTAALRIPNFLQNLLGEGVLSASFIPVYASLRARGEEDQAQASDQCVLNYV